MILPGSGPIFAQPTNPPMKVERNMPQITYISVFFRPISAFLMSKLCLFVNATSIRSSSIRKGSSFLIGPFLRSRAFIEPLYRQLLVVYSKIVPAVYLDHLDVMKVFEKALRRSGLTIDFTRGFNPKPRIEFAQPLPVGVSWEITRLVCWAEDERGNA